MQALVPQPPRTLHFVVTSKKGVIGIGVPMHFLRRKPQLLPQSPCGLFVRAPFFGGSDREPQGSPVLAGGARYANLFELPPLIGVEGGSFCKLHLLEANMADRSHARALIARTTLPTSGTPDPIQLHATAHNALGTALHHLRQPHVDAARARRKVMQALAALRGLDVALSLEG
jgi:hypothetical protein